MGFSVVNVEERKKAVSLVQSLTAPVMRSPGERRGAAAARSALYTAEVGWGAEWRDAEG